MVYPMNNRRLRLKYNAWGPDVAPRRPPSRRASTTVSDRYRALPELQLRTRRSPWAPPTGARPGPTSRYFDGDGDERGALESTLAHRSMIFPRRNGQSD